MTPRGPEGYVGEARRWKLSGADPDWALATRTEQTEAALIAKRDITEAFGLVTSRRDRGRRREDGDVYTTALFLAVAAAGERRVRKYCEHVVVDEPVSYQRLAVVLTAGVAVCERCASALPAFKSEGVDDGRCDLCDRPSQWFREFILPVGGCVVGLNACRKCSEWMVRYCSAPEGEAS
jgi:hypothetical protein